MANMIDVFKVELSGTDHAFGYGRTSDDLQYIVESMMGGKEWDFDFLPVTFTVSATQMDEDEYAALPAFEDVL